MSIFVRVIEASVCDHRTRILTPLRHLVDYRGNVRAEPLMTKQLVALYLCSIVLRGASGESGGGESEGTS